MTGRVKRALGYEPSIEVLKHILGDRKVVYYSILAKALKSISAALLLQQSLYWQCRTTDPDGWFYKTIGEFENELAMSRSVQDKAIEILVNKELIEKCVRGIPPKRHFRVNIKNVEKFLNDFLVISDEL